MNLPLYGKTAGNGWIFAFERGLNYMYYYKIEVFHDGWDRKNDEYDGMNLKQFSDRMNGQTAYFNKLYAEEWNVRFFYIREDDGVLAFYVCGIYDAVSEDRINKYIESLGLIKYTYHFSEVKISELRDDLLLRSGGEGIRKMREFLEENKLDIRCYRDFREEILRIMDEKETQDNLEHHFTLSSMYEEIKRIRKGCKNNEFVGIPVHYILRTDEEYWEVNCDVLLSELLKMKRISSRRITYLKVDEHFEHRVTNGSLDSIYHLNEGSTIVISFENLNNTERDDEYSDNSNSALEIIMKAAYHYSDKVLTIFHIPLGYTSFGQQCNEYAPNMPFVEIREQVAGVREAKKYLKLLAGRDGFTPDRNLYSKLLPGMTYNVEELQKMYTGWKSDKIMNSWYPQYKNVIYHPQVQEKEVQLKAYEELQEMIGLSEVKEIIDNALDYYRYCKICSDNMLKANHVPMHLVFTGNPGTAKTSVARLFAKIMKDNGILEKGQMVEVGRSDLVGRYVGWTAKIVKSKFEQARGGVLFIDEAYSLVDDRRGLFGDEAINTIVQEMENLRDDLIVVFAGYPKEMKEFLERNPGLRSRIAFHVPFQDYSPQELLQIGELMMKQEGDMTTQQGREKLLSIFEEAVTVPDYGNGRYVRNVLDHAKMRRAGRIVKDNSGDIDVINLKTLEAEDFISCISNDKKKNVFGFVG